MHVGKKRTKKERKFTGWKSKKGRGPPAGAAIP